MKPVLPLFPLSLVVLGYASIVSQSTTIKRPPVSFGKDVRPILSQHCFKCHGPDAAKAAGGLRLDSFEGATKSVIRPGKPLASHLLERVSDSDPETRMPPQGAAVQPLTKAQIQTLTDWIAQGAKYEKHWSFVPPVQPQFPKVKDKLWIKNAVDTFVLAKLEAAGLRPELEADKDTLAVRAAQTLTGLPPSPAELRAFRNDAKPGAYERYVDRLLATQSYGEQSARYWLDAVRYGDTHGLQLDNERAVFPYRDWVVRAFNYDLPFNQFVKWQLAGDLLPNPTTEQLIATGYVRMNLTSNEGGAIAEEFLARNTFDRVDTTSTVLLGLTVACAKCHDHKYDPIKQSEYYGLYAYFNSTKDEPLDGNIALPPPVLRAATPDQEKHISAMDAKMRKLVESIDPGSAIEWFASTKPPVPSSSNWQISPIYTAADFNSAFSESAPGEPGQPELKSWTPFTFELGKNVNNFIRKDNSFAYVKGTIKTDRAQSIAFTVGSDDGIRLWLNGKLIHSNKIGRALLPGSDAVRADFKAGDNEIIAKVVNGVSFDGLNITFGGANDARITKAVADFRRSPTSMEAKRELGETFLMVGPDSATSKAYRKLAKEKAEFESTIPMTLIAQEMAKPRPTFILKRGQYDQKGDVVTRRIPLVLGQLKPGQPNDRMGLANWMIDPANPLVARVFVNRIWQQHFGVGIVKTVEDFGSQGEWPLNQPLIDYLALNFVQNGWSVKKLNRLIVTSAAFRQSSKISPAKLSKDPENRLVSRGPRFRLDAEVIRDKALFAGGLLLDQLGGRGFKPYQPDGLWEGTSDPASSTHFYVRDKGRDLYRKSMYMFWKRTSPPPVMVTFDSPTRDSCVVRRSTTNTPLQALTLLNEPAFLEASRSMAVRVLSSRGTDEERLRFLYDISVSRPPRVDEITLLKKSLARYRSLYKGDSEAAKKLLMSGDLPQSKISSVGEQAAWMIVCSSLMNTDEFLTQH